MPPTLLGLPRELRDHIYSYVWCEPGYVRLGHRSVENGWRYEGGPTHPEPQEPRYPPPASNDVQDDDDDNDDDNDPDADQNEGAKDNETGEEETDDVEDADEEASPIDFDVDEFLEANMSDSELFEEDEEDFDDDESEFDSDEDEPKQRSRQRYKLDLLSKSFKTSLLRVNKQLFAEAMPVLYNETTFVFDTDGTSVIRFLNSLPQLARENVRRIALTGFVFMGDDGGSRSAWSGSYDEPLFRTPGSMTLFTPLGAYLASKMPDLDEVSFSAPYGGEEDFYCTWAPKELSMLLKHGGIQQLNYVFFGESAAEDLREQPSQKCYERLMGLFGGENFARHEFNVLNPHIRDCPFEWTEEAHQAALQRLDPESKYVDEHEDDFLWDWADRDLDMGGDGNVQAIIAHWW